ncbi:hypothetical protein BJ912DRAFT_982058 [Pholiota molesta]|nr:hypothetical protein BJ912DRAFT_982058 [Pholiota molesta]
MSLIYILYPEIISVIFEHAKNMTDEIPLAYETSAERERNIAFEATASRICSYFRKVALATPRLWTTIHVHGASRLENIVEMLARSGDCKLDIRVDLAKQDPQMDAENLDPIIHILLQYSLRWRSFHIGYSCERNDHPVVMQLCSAPAPNLQQLSIAIDDVAEADGTLVNRTASLPHIFKDGAPKLGFIRLRGLAIHLFRPPMDTVVILHLDQTKSIPIQYSTLNDILTYSPQLAHLSMYGDILAPGGWPIQQKTISLPALRSLRVCSISGEGYAGIMKSMDAPYLESLTLKDVQEHDLDWLWSITDKDQFETLKSLGFIEFDLNRATSKNIFEQGQKSTIINVLSEGTIEIPNGLQYVPWPGLKTLSLGLDCYDDDQEVINKVITVRKEYGCPISTFIFRISAEDMEDMLPLELEAGADLDIRFHSQNIVWPENGTHFDHDDILFY